MTTINNITLPSTPHPQKTQQRSSSEFHLLLSSALSSIRPIPINHQPYQLHRFESVHRNLLLRGFELYVVEQSLTDRSVLNPTFFINAGPSDEVRVDVYRLKGSNDPAVKKTKPVSVVWHEILDQICQVEGGRPQLTLLGTIITRPLTAIGNDHHSIIKIDHATDSNGDPDYRTFEKRLYCNINLGRMGFAPRTGLDLLPPSTSQRKKFFSSFLIPEQLDSSESEFRELVLSLINLVQAALNLFGLGPMREGSLLPSSIVRDHRSKRETDAHRHQKDNQRSFSAKRPDPWKSKGFQLPLFGLDGLLCDVTSEGLMKWKQQFDRSDEIPHSPLLNPQLVASLLSIVISIQQRLVARTNRQKLSDPFRYPRAFLKAWLNYQIACEIEPEPFLSFSAVHALLETPVSGNSPSQQLRRRFPRPKAFGLFHDPPTSLIKPTSNLKLLLDQLSELGSSCDTCHHSYESSSSSLSVGLRREASSPNGGLHIHSLHEIWVFIGSSHCDDEPMDKSRFSSQSDGHDHSLAGSGKTFLKPFVKGVASAGRSVGAGIHHAGKVVDAITDLTDRIALPRNVGSSNVPYPASAEVGPVADSELGIDARGDKSHRIKDVFKKRNVAGHIHGNSSDAGSEGYVSQAPAPRLNSTDVPPDGFLGSKNYTSRKGSRAPINYTEHSKCEDEEITDSFLIHPEDEILDHSSQGFSGEPADLKSNNRSTSKMGPVKRRHTIQTAGDYDSVSVRHSLRKQKLEVELVWKYRQLQRLAENQRSMIKAFEALEKLYQSTAMHAEIRSRQVKNRLEGYVEHSKLAEDLLPLSPNGSAPSFWTSTRPQQSNLFPHSSVNQPRQTLISNKGLSPDLVDSQTRELYQELMSAGEILRQRRHEVSNKRRMFDHHVQELIKQAGLKRAPNQNDSRPLKSSHEDHGLQDENRTTRAMGRDAKARLGDHLTNQIGDQNYDDDEPTTEEIDLQRSSKDEKLVSTMTERLIETIEEDPTIKVGMFVNLVVLSLSRMMSMIFKRLGGILKGILRICLAFCVAQLERLSVQLNSLDDEDQDGERTRGPLGSEPAAIDNLDPNSKLRRDGGPFVLE